MDYDWIVRLEKNNITGFYSDSCPVVKMDGTGKSASDEISAIKECYYSLKNNNYLNTTVLANYLIRLIFFSGRKILEKIGLKKIIVLLKKRKYSTISD
jgi:hypothetical protein